MDCYRNFPPIHYGRRGKYPLRTVGDALFSSDFQRGELFNHNTSAAQIKNHLDRERLGHIPEGKGIRYKQDEDRYLPKKLRYNISWNKMAEGRFRQTRLQRLDRNLPSPTILTSSSSYYHPTEPRRLTVREAAACQSFPHDFIFSGSRTSQFRQIGNAVPPILAMAVGKKLTEIFARKAKAKIKNKERVFVKHFDKNAFDYASNTVA